MSKVLLLAAVLTVVLVSAACAQHTALLEDFSGGVNYTGAYANNVTSMPTGQWIWFYPTSGNATATQAPTVVNDAVTNGIPGGDEGNKALKTFACVLGSANSLAGQAVYNLPAVAGKNWKLEWDFYTESPATDNAQREFVSAYGYTTAGGASLVNAAQFGVYNTMASPHTGEYDFRVVMGNGTVAADSPQQTLAGGWGWSDVDKVAPAPLDDPDAIANAWQHMAIEASFVTGASYQTLNFYIDGAKVVTWRTTTPFGVSQIRVGSGLPNGTGGGLYSAYFDNIQLTVPEPGSMLALGTGLVGLLGFLRRRRA